jgi:hypothetical protein
LYAACLKTSNRFLNEDGTICLRKNAILIIPMAQGKTKAFGEAEKTGVHEDRLSCQELTCDGRVTPEK